MTIKTALTGIGIAAMTLLPAGLPSQTDIPRPAPQKGSILGVTEQHTDAEVLEALKMESDGT